MFTKEQKEALYKKKIIVDAEFAKKAKQSKLEEEERDSDNRVKNIVAEINETGLPYSNYVYHNDMRKLVVKKLRNLNLTVAYSLSERIMSRFIQYDVVFRNKFWE